MTRARCTSFWRTDPVKSCIAAAALAGAVCLSDAHARQIEVGELEALGKADIYLLGEFHDNALHHERQAAAIQTISPAAILFEMLTPEQVAAADGVSRTDSAALDAAFGWTGSGWPDFAIYASIFAAAPDAALYGAALPRADVRRAISDGAAAVFGSEAAAFGLIDPLPQDQQTAREGLQARAHCDALPEEMLPGMVEAQRLRDAHFSRVALQALGETGGPVAVITGNGHIRKWAMPAALMAAAPETAVVSLAQLHAAPPSGEYDLWLLSDAPQTQDDPCAAFRSN